MKSNLDTGLYVTNHTIIQKLDKSTLSLLYIQTRSAFYLPIFIPSNQSCGRCGIFTVTIVVSLGQDL